MNKNKTVLIIIILIIIIEICTTVILLNKNNDNKNIILSPTAEEYMGSQDGFSIENYSELLTYNVGNISKADIIDVLNEYVTGVLPVAYSSINSSENDLKIAYLNNKTGFQKCGIHNSEELKKLSKKTNNTKEVINFEEYKTAKFTGIEFDEEYTIVKAEVTYVNYRKINVKMKFADKIAKVVEFEEQ